ncbi:MAG: hypothetical protein JSS35_14390 [Proteobacteria bacterium]|nr:hypothetical protein [Pseudomonadota bacterium]
MREAGLACDDIERPMGDLGEAARLAAKAIVLGAVSKDNACIRLVRLSRQFVAETLRGRRQVVDQLLEASVLVGEALGRAEGKAAPLGQANAHPDFEPPAREPRKDIFG